MPRCTLCASHSWCLAPPVGCSKHHHIPDGRTADAVRGLGSAWPRRHSSRHAAGVLHLLGGGGEAPQHRLRLLRGRQQGHHAAQEAPQGAVRRGARAAAAALPLEPSVTESTSQLRQRQQVG
jgi:hypothetical protein